MTKRPHRPPPVAEACSYGTPWADHFPPPAGTGKGCAECQAAGVEAVSALTPPGYFTCVRCRQVFPRVDEPAEREAARRKFGDELPDLAAVCDGCYEMLMGRP